MRRLRAGLLRVRAASRRWRRAAIPLQAGSAGAHAGAVSETNGSAWFYDGPIGDLAVRILRDGGHELTRAHWSRRVRCRRPARPSSTRCWHTTTDHILARDG